eukprot:1157627-Pelagomonas_calceolata.AAC.4
MSSGNPCSKLMTSSAKVFTWKGHYEARSSSCAGWAIYGTGAVLQTAVQQCTSTDAEFIHAILLSIYSMGGHLRPGNRVLV